MNPRRRTTRTSGWAGRSTSMRRKAGIPARSTASVGSTMSLPQHRSGEGFFLDLPFRGQHELADHSPVMLNRDRVTSLALLHQVPRDLERLVETICLVEAVLSGLADDVVRASSHVTLLHPVNVDPEVVKRRPRIDA